MSKIDASAFRNWNNGETMNEADYEQEREIIRTAINDNYTRLIAKYDATQVDSLLNAMKGSGWTSAITIKGNYDLIQTILGNRYTKTEVDGFISNLQSQITSNDGDITALQSGKADKSVTYTKTEVDNSLALKADKSTTYTKLETDSLLLSNKTGNHEGTWQGLTPQTLGADGVNASRITKLEEDTQSTNTLVQSYNRGQTAITADQDTPFNVTRIEGRTLVNLLGRDGNCEDVSKFSTYQGTINLDTANFKVYGSNSIALNIGTGYTLMRMYKQIPVTTGRYYILVSDVKKGTATNVQVYALGYGDGNSITNGSGVSYKKFSPTATGNLEIGVSATGTAGQNAYADGIRLYEITAQEYADLDTMTPEQIAAKYPYVDDVKGLTGAYAQVIGKNLIPPFNEWTLTNNPAINSLYDLSYNQTDTTQRYVAEYWLDVIEGQTYTAQREATLGAQFQIYGFDKINGSPIQNMGQSAFVGFVSEVFTIPTGVKALRIRAYTSAQTGVHTWKNPQLELGTTATAFEPQRKSYASLPTTLYGDETTGIRDTYDAETNTVNRRFKEVVLDGSLGWTFSADYAGFKRVSVSGFSDVNRSVGPVLVKYNGQLLMYDGATWDKSDEFFINPSYELLLTISDTDSGWGETYTPTADEIKMNFMGWRMYIDGDVNFAPYNGTGTKRWYDPLNTATKTYDVEYGKNNYANTLYYTPHKLIYQLASATQETVQLIGDAMLSAGTNTVTVGEGLVQREVAKPYFSNGNYYINDINSRLKYRGDKIVGVYVGEDLITDYNSYKDANSNGNFTIQIPEAKFDKTAVYYIDYITEGYAYSSSIVSLDAEYSKNIRSTVNELVRSEAEHERRIDVIETTYARKAQPGWIAPVLLNGWTSFSKFAYKKDDFGFVHIRGQIRSGTMTIGTVLFYLPVGYRPSVTEWLDGFTWSTSTDGKAALITVSPDGAVKLEQAVIGPVTIGTSFQAEQ